MFYFNREPKTEREEYLESELERYQEQERRDYEERERQREIRLQERKEAHEWEMRSAFDWPEALEKQALLFQREANLWLDDEDDDPRFKDDYFGPGAEACRFALKVWQEIEAESQAEIDALLAQIDAIKEKIKNQVADRVEEENSESGWRHVASAIRTEDPGAWLQW